MSVILEYFIVIKDFMAVLALVRGEKHKNVVNQEEDIEGDVDVFILLLKLIGHRETEI